MIKNTSYIVPNNSDFNNQIKRISLKDKKLKLYKGWNLVSVLVANNFNTTVTELENVENQLYRCVQIECFPEETTSLKNGKTVSSNSRLIQLDPEYDEQTDLIRVGGRLRRADGLSDSTKHPIVLDPKHHITKLLIKDYDEKLTSLWWRTLVC
jgi:alanine racemase